MTAGLIHVNPLEIVLVADTLCLNVATGLAIAGGKKGVVSGGKASDLLGGSRPGRHYKKKSGVSILLW